jgi:hypothetical protein
MTESDEERATLERATETAKRLQKPRAEFSRHGARRLPKMKPPQVREATVRHVENKER